MSMGKDLIEEKLVEDGASLEHERWARWQKYMFSKGTVDSDGIFHLPKEFVDRWFRQIDTPYSELSESEKESDRKETKQYLPLLRQSIEEAVAKERKKLSTLKSEVEKIKLPVPNPYGKWVKVENVNKILQQVINLIEKHQNEG